MEAKEEKRISDDLAMTACLRSAVIGQAATLRFLAERARSEWACRNDGSPDELELLLFQEALERASITLSEAGKGQKA